jgi:hypothetical protein
VNGIAKAVYESTGGISNQEKSGFLGFFSRGNIGGNF